MRYYHHKVYVPLTFFIQHFMNIFKDQYPSLLIVQDCCMHVKGFIEDLENMYGDDEFMDEDIL